MRIKLILLGDSYFKWCLGHSKYAINVSYYGRQGRQGWVKNHLDLLTAFAFLLFTSQNSHPFFILHLKCHILHSSLSFLSLQPGATPQHPSVTPHQDPSPGGTLTSVPALRALGLVPLWNHILGSCVVPSTLWYT